MTRERLYAPGPVPVPPQVLAALAQPVVHHRSQGFRELFLSVRSRLAEVFAVPGDDVVVLTGSGTAGFEAALLACVGPGEKVLCLRSGRFGEKWVDVSRRFGLEVTQFVADYGTEYELDALRSQLEELQDVAAVIVVHSETSTGMLHDVERIARVVRETARDALVIVDAVSSLAAAELRPREWDLDVVVSGSQKGVMVPPGLAFAWLSTRAVAREGGRAPTYYLDLRTEIERQREGQTGSTPATSLIAALDVSLDLILERGIEQRWQLKERLNRSLLAAGTAVGLRRFASRPSPAVAALATPEGVDASRIVSALREDGIYVGGGQGDLKERILRPSLLGHTDEHDLVVLSAGLEVAARRVGLKPQPGVAVAAASEAWHEAASGR